MSDYPKLDVVMLDNWLRGCALNIAGEDCTFPRGREFFGRMLLGERIKLEAEGTRIAQVVQDIASEIRRQRH